MIPSMNKVKIRLLPLASIYSNISWYLYTENTIFKWIYTIIQLKIFIVDIFTKYNNRSGYSTKIYIELFLNVKSKLKIPCKTLRKCK